MKNSSFPSESFRFAAVLLLLLVGGVAMQWWREGFNWLPLVWLALCLACLGWWLRRI